MQAGGVNALLPLLIVAFVVIRFALRELRLRTVRSPQLWIRPAIVVLVAAWVVALTISVDAGDLARTIGCIVAGALAGIAVGAGIVRNTTFTPAPMPRAVRVQGSRITLAIWVGALLLRVAARFVWPAGADPRAQLPLNCGAVVLAAVAFVWIASTFESNIRRFAAAGHGTTGT